MYQIDKDSNELLELEKKLFSELGFSERSHLQEWIAKRPDCLGEDLLIIQKEFDGFGETRERLDLLALDKKGRLVVIENKLDDSGRDVVWQALKYASYCSSLSNSQILDIYQDYLDKNGGGKADENITDFLEIEDIHDAILNPGIEQRVIFVAANFRREVTSTVMWLLQHGLRIQCFKATPFEGENKHLFLVVDQIIPTPEAEDFMISIAEKEKEQETAKRTMARREVLRMDFWKMMLEELRQRGTKLFRNVNPTRDNWLNTGSGLSGVAYNMVFSKKDARVALNINRKKKSENKRIFDLLRKNKEKIEAQFGDTLEWNRKDDHRLSQIIFRKEFAGFERESWREMIDWIAEHIIKLEAAISPHLEKVRREFRDGENLAENEPVGE